MTARASEAYESLIAGEALRTEERIEQLSIGLTWTSCRTEHGLSFAMSPGTGTRVLPWPGTLRGRKAGEVAGWLGSDNPFEATVGLAAANAVINRRGNALMESAEPIASRCPANLAVFEHFRGHLEGLRTIVVGRYPGLDEVLAGLDFRVLELNPTAKDLPASAAGEVLPQADWVFITATSLINKTFPELAALSCKATSVLMGPSCPWLAEWREFGIDYLAGVRLVDSAKAEQIAMEGGGTRLFGEGVSYAVACLGQQ